MNSAAPDGAPFRDLDYEVSDGIATIKLNRPDHLNAFTATMARELVAAFDRVDLDDGVRVVIVTGAGRGFCAGADLAARGTSFDVGDPARRAERADFGMIGGVPRDSGGMVALRIAACRKPVIAAVNGPAVGVGATMQLPMDIRIASNAARFGFVFARRGLVPEAASSWFLPRVVGISRAMEWTATGRIFDSAEALAGGLVSRITEPDTLLPTARQIALEIAENTSAVSVALTRQLLWSMLGAASPWEAHAADSRLIATIGAAADTIEGVESFLERRPPRFPLTVGRNYPDVLPAWPARPAHLT